MSDTSKVWGSVDRALHSLRPQSANNDQDQVEVRPFLSEDGPSLRLPTARSWGGLLIVTAVATMFGTVFPAGYNIGILNSPQQVIVDFCNASLWHNYGMQIEDKPLDLLWAFVVSIFLIGGGIGAMMGGTIANRIGRKKALLVNCTLNVIASVLFGTCGLARSVEMLLIGRLIVGLGAGMSTSFMPVYMAEISTPATQNVLGILCPIGITTGLFLGQVLSLEKLLGNEDNWNLLLALTCVPPLMCLAVWYFLPESPRYLFVIEKHDEEATKQLCRLRGLSASELEAELEALRREADASVKNSDSDDESNWTLQNIWAKKSLRWPVVCVVVMHMGNQLSGINVVFYYSTDIFQSAGLDKQQAELALLGAGFVNILMTASAAWFTGRFGRRPLMLTSTIGVSTFLIVLAVTIYYMSRAAWIPYVCIASLMIYVIVFDIGVGPLPFFLPSELIPAGPRPLVMSLGCMFNWSCNFVIGMIFPSLEDALGVYAFGIFAAATFAQTIFLYFKLPETFHPRVAASHPRSLDQKM